MIINQSNLCPVCGIPRIKKVHSKCSRQLQKRSRQKWYKEEMEKSQEGQKLYNANVRATHELCHRIAKITRPV